MNVFETGFSKSPAGSMFTEEFPPKCHKDGKYDKINGNKNNFFANFMLTKD